MNKVIVITIKIPTLHFSLLLLLLFEKETKLMSRTHERDTIKSPLDLGLLKSNFPVIISTHNNCQPVTVKKGSMKFINIYLLKILFKGCSYILIFS